MQLNDPKNDQPTEPHRFPAFSFEQDFNDDNNFHMEYEIETNENVDLDSSQISAAPSPIQSLLSSNRPHLSNFQNDLIESMNNVRSNSAITTAALKSTFIELSSTILKNFSDRPYSAYNHQELVKAVNSSYAISANDLQIRTTIATQDCQYFSVKEIITKYLSVRKFFEEVIKEREKSRDPRIISSIYDLDKVKRLEDLTRGTKNVNIYIDFYIDDKNITQNNMNYNMTLVYITLANIRFKFLTKRKSIGCLGVGKKTVVKELGLRKFFQPIRQEINELEPIKLNGYDFYLHYFSMKADNKGCNEMIVNINQSFMSCSCKYCKIHYSQIPSLIMGEKRILDKEHALYGIYIVTDSFYSPDIFHDLVENGVIEKLFINFNLDNNEVLEINKRIQKLSKLLGISMSTFILFKDGRKIKLKGKGIEKYYFFILFAIVYKFETDSMLFELYHLLRQIIDICDSTIIFKTDIQFLEKLVNKFLVLFKLLFPSETITFKMHHMQHYSTLILEFGNLVFSSTLRYERVHQKVQRSIEGSRNKKNPAFSIANAFIFDPNCNFEKIEKHLIKNLTLSEIDVEYKSYLTDLNISNQDAIHELKKIKISNQSFALDNFYLYKYKHDNLSYPVFVKIKKLLLAKENPFIFGEAFKAVNFDKSKEAFEVITEHQVIKINLDDLDHFSNLLAFKSTGKIFLVKNFHVPFELSNSYLNLLTSDELADSAFLNQSSNANITSNQSQSN